MRDLSTLARSGSGKEPAVSMTVALDLVVGFGGGLEAESVRCAMRIDARRCSDI